MPHAADPAPSSRRWLPPLLAVPVLAAVIATVVLLARPAVTVQGDYLAFGTRVWVRLHAPDQEAADRALDRIGALLVEDHRRWHAWEPSEVTRLNQALAAGHTQRVDADIASLIDAARVGYQRSDGLFNAAAGRLISAWGFHTSQYPVRSSAPAAEQLDALRTAQPGMPQVHVDDRRVVSADRREVQLDFNGLAEGYAAGQMRQLLREQGIRHGLIYVGGFVLAVGQDGAHPWQAGVRGPQGLLATLDLHDGEALSSSGSYQRRRSPEVGVGGHIIDPRSGQPERDSAGASVIAADPVLADMAATALMVAGPRGFDALTRRMQLRCALLIGSDGRVWVTRGMYPRLRWEGGSAPAGAVRPSTLDGDCADHGSQAPLHIVLPPALQ